MIYCVRFLYDEVYECFLVVVGFFDGFFWVGFGLGYFSRVFVILGFCGLVGE